MERRYRCCWRLFYGAKVIFASPFPFCLPLSLLPLPLWRELLDKFCVAYECRSAISVAILAFDFPFRTFFSFVPYLFQQPPLLSLFLHNSVETKVLCLEIDQSPARTSACYSAQMRYRRAVCRRRRAIPFLFSLFFSSFFFSLFSSLFSVNVPFFTCQVFFEALSSKVLLLYCWMPATSL